ncbi:MAG TPA: ammonia channel protein, partial [Methylophilaceae bacterium]|nr:ammonia channel protein [Methylophilaceae bacterium]
MQTEAAVIQDEAVEAGANAETGATEEAATPEYAPSELTEPALNSAVQAAEVVPAVPAAPAPPTAPYVTSFDNISTGDTAWMLTATALVLLMTIPGLALFYAGMVRKK